jgi:uncharacterized membrane protein YkvA (DUF1232 family)
MSKTTKFDDDTLKAESNKYTPKNEDEIKAKVLNKEEKLNGLFASVSKLKPYWDDFKTIFSMIKDWVTGKYKEVPFTTIASLAGVLIYVITPIDLIVDYIPLLGYADDAAILGFAIKLAKNDIEKYRAWVAKNSKPKELYIDCDTKN